MEIFVEVLDLLYELGRIIFHGFAWLGKKIAQTWEWMRERRGAR